MLFYKVGPSPSEWWGMLKTSKDCGKTWSHEVRLPEDILDPIKNKPFLIAHNTLICPSSTEDKNWKAHFEITEDYGRTWRIVRLVDSVNKFNIIQPSILFHENGKLQILARSWDIGYPRSVQRSDGKIITMQEELFMYQG